MVASAGEQAGWHARAQGWPRLVSEGLREVGHFEAAHELPSHPFSSAAALSHSTVFAISKVAEQGEPISEWRRKQKRHLMYRSRQLKPLTEKLMALADEEARHLFAQSHVAFVLYLCILMEHAGVTYRSRCTMGFEVVGEIKSPPVFRSARPEVDPPSVEAFASGNTAHLEDFARSIKSSPNPDENHVLREQSLKDVKNGFAQGPLDLQDIVKRFGLEWRCFPRFAMHQAHNDKWHAIDDGKRSGHNEVTAAWVCVHA